MTQVWIEQQATLGQPHDRVFEALLLALPRMGLRLRAIGREQGIVTALMPPWALTDELSISLFPVGERSTCVTLQCAVPLPPSVAAIALRQQSARQVLAVLQRVIDEQREFDELSCADGVSEMLASAHSGAAEASQPRAASPNLKMSSTCGEVDSCNPRT